MKARTKETIRDGFGGLFRNATALRGAKNGPLWLTIVMFFASILLPIIPLFVSANSVTGSSFIRNNSYNLERYITKTALDLNKEGYEIKIDENHFLTMNKSGQDVDFAGFDDGETMVPFYTYVNKVNNKYDFIVYVSDINKDTPKVEVINSKGKKSLVNAKTNYLNRVATNIEEQIIVTYFDEYDEAGEYNTGKFVFHKNSSNKPELFKCNANGVTGEWDDKKWDSATLNDAKKDTANPMSYNYPSYMVLFRDSFNVVICYGEKAVAGTSNGAADYKHTVNDECLKTLLTVKDKDDKDVVAENASIDEKMANEDYCNGVLKNFKKFLNDSYLASKAKTTLITCLFSLAVFAGMSLIMGFLMWIMTRGKNNPNNYFSLWLCLKLEARLALAPGLITLLLGFLLTSYAQMIFVLTLGMRVMWISMKELRPVQQ